MCKRLFRTFLAIELTVSAVAFGMCVSSTAAQTASSDRQTDSFEYDKLEDPDVGASETHLWLAQQFQTAVDDEQDEATRQARVQEQIDLALATGPLAPMAHLTLGNIYERRAHRFGKETDEYRESLTSAIEHLQASISTEIVSVEQVVAIPRMIDYYHSLNRVDENVFEIANKMIKKIRPFARETPNQIFVWRAMIQCAVKTKQYNLAREIIREGFITSSSNSVRRQIAGLAGSVLIQEADEHSDMLDDVAFLSRLDRLGRAINVTPTNSQIYSRLLEFVTKDPSGFYQPRRLERALPKSEQPAVLHSVAGFSAAMEGNKQVAQSHWNIARQQYTLLPVVLNELLKATIRSDAAEFADPLPLFEVAIDSLQHNALLLQTRGLYFRTRGRNAEAIIDLESAIAQHPNLVEARKLLIILYTKSGDSAKAAEHQQMLDEILAKLTDEQRIKLESRLESIK